MNGNFNRYIVRFIVAAYLIYLGVKLISDVLKGTDPVDNPALFIAFGAAFIVIAAVLSIFTIIKMKNEPSTSSEPVEPIEEAKEDEAEAESKEESLEEADDEEALEDTAKAMLTEEEEEDSEDEV